MFLRPLLCSLGFLLLSAMVNAATISTIAGTGTAGSSGAGGPATAAQLDNPFGIARGPDGALWFAQYTGQRISKITSDGILQQVAGTGRKGYTGDGGPALAATFNLPHELRFDREGNCYVADMMNHAIRRIDARTQIITTFTGTGTPGYTGDDGPAVQAELKQPHSIQFDPGGAHLYICDLGNNVIRRVDMRTGIITTFAGTGLAGDTPDGAPITGTPLKGPRSIDFDAQGDLWLVAREGNQLLRFDLKAGVIHLIAGTGKKGFSGNGGPAREATLSGPKGVAIDAAGNAWLADTESHTIRMVEAKTGRLLLMAGTGEKGDGPPRNSSDGEGDPLQCKLSRPHGVFVDADGAIYIGDSESHRIRVLRK